MLTNRQLFLRMIGQTSESPLLLEIEKAEGIYLYQSNGTKLIDLIAGISVSNLGHRNPKVIEAIKSQLDKYLHLMVYGEIIQNPQVKLAELLTRQLPKNLDCIFYVNSGSEANEAALKLAKRFTGRSEIIACHNAYHGSSHGVLSLHGDADYQRSFRPLLPDIQKIEFNNLAQINLISEKTACVIVEPIQGEAGIILPHVDFLNQLRKRCTQMGALLIFDEVQTGFGRTGELFAFQKYRTIPDILTLAKGFGGGMPLGGIISSREILNSFTKNPVLGHITTFGGHPVSCAASLQTLEILLSENIVQDVDRKGQIFLNLLKHPKIKNIRGTGLFFAVELENFETILRFIRKAIEHGLLTDWFLFCNNCFRIAPPLIISDQQIYDACNIIINSLNEIE